MIFASIDLVARIERAEVSMLRECADAVRAARPDGGVIAIPIAGGAAAYTGPDSPMNKIAGMGFGAALDEGALEEVERAFAERGCAVQAEVATLADPAIGVALTRRGYVLMGFENVLGLDLSRFAPTAAEGDIEIDVDEDFDSWIDLIVTGFASADAQGVASHESFPRDAMERAIRDIGGATGFLRFVARRGGDAAGAASMRIHEGICQLTGAATLPAHRRRGVQSALLGYRLGEARRAGCDLAIVTTLPGSKSQENVQKLGFELLYVRAHLVKGEG